MNGTILVINGTSGSGKSTACEKFVQSRDDFWLLYGIDHFTAGSVPPKYGHHGPFAEQGYQAVPRDPADPDGPLRWQFGPKGQAAFATLHDWVASASRNGCNIAFDHLLFSDPPVLQDLAWRISDCPALLVTLKPPYDVLRQRVEQRAMTKKLPVEILGEEAARCIVDRLGRLRDWFYDEVYRNPVCDLEIDTSVHGPDEVVAMIARRLEQGPGTAFETIRSRNPKPW
ncbi:MAG TPA: chloramphenicol phosphotransferase [Novosphingobium sp.]|nr:chloramphenicol phosphotransferase [Novosphingobium sp.]